MTDAHVRELMFTNAIQIVDFVPKNMKLSHYRLRPLHLFKPGRQLPDGSHELNLPLHDFRKGEPYPFGPNEYLIATTMEHIILGPDIVGEVIAASTLVVQCFDIVSGKLDPGYGNIDGNPQDFIIGIKNQLDESNLFYPGRGIANISFKDYRGVRTFKPSWRPEEKADFRDRDLSQRRAYFQDHGPTYPEDDD